MLSHFYMKREGDEKLILEFKTKLYPLTNEELMERFESALQCGIVGVHAQCLYLFVLWKVGKERNLPFSTDPEGGIQIIDGRILSIHPLTNVKS